MLTTTLVDLAKELNQAGVRWGVGASVLLWHYGLADNPHDIDLMAAEQDVDRITAALDRLGMKETGSEQGPYATSRFLEYVVDGIDIDLMAGFGIRHGAGVYTYVFDERAVTGKAVVGGVVIPLTALEDWYVLYQLMQRREHRVRVIEDYLAGNGSAHTDLLERALSQPLPPDVRSRIECLVASIAKRREPATRERG
ncbi:MAG: nucleotidyltransferase domain-containing protein [Candidatus Cryosericum sp.]